jgi:hypothetical protein
LLPPEEVEGILFQCIFLKKLPSAMSDPIMAADLDNIEAMADMADRLHDKPSRKKRKKERLFIFSTAAHLYVHKLSD